MLRLCNKDLNAADGVLTKSYSKLSPDRLMCMALYYQLRTRLAKESSEKRNNVLTGALVFYLADIKFREYYGGSPKKGKNGLLSWLSSSGSEFYYFVKDILEITKLNKFSYDERIFYFHQFYEYMTQEYPEEIFGQLTEYERIKEASKDQPLVFRWKNNQLLLADIETARLAIVKKNSDILNYLVHGVPVFNVLLQGLETLLEDYKKESANPENPERLKAIYFIKFVVQCTQLSNPTEDSWRAILGAVLTILLELKDEYDWYYMDPNRSALFRALLKLINQTSLDNITKDDRIKWLRAVNEHVIFFSKCETYDSILKKIFVNSAHQKQEVENLKVVINQKKEKIEQRLSDLNQPPSPSWGSWFAQKGATYGSQLVAMPFVFPASKMVISGISTLAKTAGSVVFGPTGTVVMSGLGFLIGEGLLDSASAALCAWVLAKIGDKVSNATNDLIVMSFEATPKGMEDMRKKLKPIDDIVFVNMVNTMLEMYPIKDEKGKEYLTVADKERMRKLLGLKEEEKLKPLPTSLSEIETKEKIRELGYAVRDLRPKEESESEEEEYQSDLKVSI